MADLTIKHLFVSAKLDGSDKSLVKPSDWNEDLVYVGELPIQNGGTGQTTEQAAINALAQVSAATDEYVLTKDTATGDVIFKQIQPSIKEIVFADSPYSASNDDDIILADATNGDIVVIPVLAAVLTKKQTVMMVDGQTSGNTVDIVPGSSELINKASNKLISVDLVAWTYISDGTQLLIVA